MTLLTFSRIVKSNVSKHSDDIYKPLPQDDVYPLKYYRWVVYTAEDAVRAHQQTHHPSMYNVPDALVFAHIEFNMVAAKKVGRFSVTKVIMANIVSDTLCPDGTMT